MAGLAVLLAEHLHFSESALSEFKSLSRFADAESQILLSDVGVLFAVKGYAKVNRGVRIDGIVGETHHCRGWRTLRVLG